MHFRTAKPDEGPRCSGSRLRQEGFTLIELLVVIAIIAILSVVVILTLNPSQLLMSGRDANRISDMSTLNSAISIYLSAGGSSLGNTNTVYVSIPDPTATSTAGDQCQGLGLPALPSTYSYHCATTSTVRNVDSTGWIPINFGTVAIVSSLSQLPIDPINQSSSRLYYAYATNGTQFEVTSAMESAKYRLGGSNDVVSGDGSTLATVYAKGSNVNIEPLDYGDTSLVGLWSFNEGTGTVAYDYSGNNATGSWSGTQAGTNGYYSAGKVGPWAGAFDGSTDYVSSNSNLPTGNSARTMSLWFKTSTSTSSNWISWGTNSSNQLSQVGIYAPEGLGYLGYSNDLYVSPTPYINNQWHDLAVTFDGINMNLYIDGLLVTSGTKTLATGVSALNIGRAITGTNYFPGLIDDVRIYNRALSASEIAAMYNGGK